MSDLKQILNTLPTLVICIQTIGIVPIGQRSSSKKKAINEEKIHIYWLGKSSVNLNITTKPISRVKGYYN